MADHFPHLRRVAHAAAATLTAVVVASAALCARSADAQSRSATYNAPADSPGGFSAIAARVTPAVVSIRSEFDANNKSIPRNEMMPGPPQDRTATGSGFIVTSSGYVLTNNHVVSGADRVSVGLPDRREFPATVVGRDAQTDIAVLKIQATGLPTLPLGDDTQARVGDWVLAVGNPLQLDFTVTAGIISAKGRANELRELNADRYAIQDFIQTDAAINPGNSGGPLVNTRGEAIGINSAIASPTGTYAGYGFAVPISLAKTVMDDLIAHGRVRRAILGAVIADVTQEDAGAAQLPTIGGVKVEDFSPPGDSPAKRAGLEPGDVLVAVDGRPLDRVSTLQRVIRTHQPGDDVNFDVVRYGVHRSVRVRLAEAPADVVAIEPSATGAAGAGGANRGTAATSLGIMLSPLPPEAVAQLGETIQGALVTQVRRGGPAEGKLIPGDIITAVIHPEPRVTTQTVDALMATIGRLHAGDYVGLLINRQADTQGHRSTAVVNVRIGQ